MSALDAVLARRSWSRVEDRAPEREELLALIAAAGRVADHSSLRPWRIIELRGDDRKALGVAIATATAADAPSTKPLRAPLLLAVVASYRDSEKVPRWEQEAVASGVAHVLSLLLDEKGWGVIWRTGGYTRHPAVAAAHGLSEDEALLGWLYVGAKPAEAKQGRRTLVDAESFLSAMPATQPAPDGQAAALPAEQGKKDTKQGKKAKKQAKKAKKRAKKERARAERNA